MTISDGIMIFAVVMAPFLAVHAQSRINNNREKRQRKQRIFRTLMATRAARISFEHVQALNMIDVEFHGKSSGEVDVRDKWKEYLDHLNDGTQRDASPTGWVNKNNELFGELMYAMSECLDYHFDKVLLTKGAYYPEGHGDQEDDQILIRKQLVKLLKGDICLPLDVRSLPPE